MRKISQNTYTTVYRTLMDNGLIQRRVVTSKPIQSYYSLTEKGKEVAEILQRLNKVL